MTAIELSPLDAASDALDAARAELANRHTTRERWLAKRDDLRAALHAAERASIAAAATDTSDDDATALRAVSDARERLRAVEQAAAENDAAIDQLDIDIVARAQAVARERAQVEIDHAIAQVPAFERSLGDLVATITAIEEAIARAKRQGVPLTVPLVVGRRLGHVLAAAGVRITTDGDASAADRTPAGAARLIRSALENPSWSVV